MRSSTDDWAIVIGAGCTLAFYFREGVVARLQLSTVLFSYCSLWSVALGMSLHLDSL